MKRVLDYFLVFLAGASIMIIEIAGARMLAPAFGAGIFVWAFLLTVVLAALSAGYFIGGTLCLKYRFLEARHLLLIAAVLVTASGVARSPVLRLVENFGPRWGSLMASFILFFPSELLCGAVSPIVAERVKSGSVGKTVGRVCALASLGSILGALCTGLFLVPNFSLRAIFPGVGIMLATFSLLSSLVSRRRAEGMLFAVTLVFLPTSLLLGSGRMEEKHVLYSCSSAYGQLDVLDIANARLLLIDGIIHTVMPRHLISEGVAEDAFPPGNYFSLLKSIHPRGKRALVIGLGGGLIPKLLSAQGISTDCVEIDPKVLEIARKYFGYKERTFVTDGRTFLHRTSEIYDFIILDAFASDQLVVHLFSRECFEEAASKLAKEGILAINFIGEPKEILTASLKKTLETVFPHVLFVPTKGDESVQVLQVFARKKPLRILGPSQVSEMELLSYQQSLFSYSPSEGVVITDDRNPLELEWAAVAARWRRDCKEYLDFLLSKSK